MPSAGFLGQPGLEPSQDVGRGGSRSEDLLDPAFLELRDVLLRDDPSAEHQHVAGTLVPEELYDPREEGHMRARMTRQADRVGVFLDGRFGDLFGRLVKSGVDDLIAGVSEGPGHDLRAAVVPVQSGLGDDDPIGLCHLRSRAIEDLPPTYTRALMPIRRIRFRPPGAKPWTKIGPLGPF